MGTYCGHIDVDEKAIGPPPGPARMYWDNPNRRRNNAGTPATSPLALISLFAFIISALHVC